jgi:group I intron endonuclease
MFIYKITNTITQKSYIGQTTRPIEKRFEQHQKSNRCVAIYGAIEKYGWDNFEKDWYECPDEDLNFDEELLVREMETLSPGGYNLREGGGNCGKMSEESNRRNSEAKKGAKNPNWGKPRGNETKQKIREGNIGKTRSDETKKNISETKLGEKNHNSKQVYQYDLEGKYIQSFGSTREAARYLNKKDGSCIGKCAFGELNTAYKFKWSYSVM